MDSKEFAFVLPYCRVKVVTLCRVIFGIHTRARGGGGDCSVRRTLIKLSFLQKSLISRKSSHQSALISNEQTVPSVKVVFQIAASLGIYCRLTEPANARTSFLNAPHRAFARALHVHNRRTRYNAVRIRTFARTHIRTHTHRHK